MKQYLLSVHHHEGDPLPSEDEFPAVFAAVDAFNAELQKSGSWVFAGGLYPPENSTVVRIDHDKVVTTDGPYAESKEHMGGFWIIQAPDLDAALKLAEQGARACRNAVQVRPFQDEPES